jgi:hypothetical protein
MQNSGAAAASGRGSSDHILSTWAARSSAAAKQSETACVVVQPLYCSTHTQSGSTHIWIIRGACSELAVHRQHDGVVSGVHYREELYRVQHPEKVDAVQCASSALRCITSDIGLQSPV